MTDNARERLRSQLIELARAGRTATYAQVGSQVGLDVRRGADMNFLTSSLRAVSEAEHHQGRPLLSAVCVMAGVKRPGQGFFDLARQVGLMQSGQDNREFFETEVARVHAYWKDAAL